MFYRPAEGHPFKHNPIGAIVSPRPIAWISSRDSAGVENLAPYSFFNLVAYQPPQLMFASVSGKPDQTLGKDTLQNIRETGVFCVNVADANSVDAVNYSSGHFDKSEDEFALAGVTRTACQDIACSRVADAPASLECKLDQIIQLAGAENFLTLGTVVGIHLREDCLVNDRFDVTRYQPLTRLGYKDYSVIETTFEAERHKA